MATNLFRTISLTEEASNRKDIMPDPEAIKRLSTGIVGLDEVLYGELLPQRSYLVRGTAGTGKTTLGLHFLTAGAAPIAMRELTWYTIK